MRMLAMSSLRAMPSTQRSGATTTRSRSPKSATRCSVATAIRRSSASYVAQYSSLRRASLTTVKPRAGRVAAKVSATMSRLQPPRSPTSSTYESVCAVTMPTRRPVNGPGPTPTTMPARSASTCPDSATTSLTSGISCSAWTFVAVTARDAKTCPGRATAAVTPVEVSMPSQSPLSDSLIDVLWGCVDGEVDPCPPGADAGQRHRTRLVVRVDRALDHHVEPSVAQLFRLALAPLDHSHRVGQGGIEIEVLDLGEVGQTVCIDMDESRPVRAGAMDTRQHERRRDHRTHHVEASADALGEGGLAGAQLTDGEHEVARLEQGCQTPAESVHARGRRYDDDAGLHSRPPSTDGQCYDLRCHPPCRGDRGPVRGRRLRTGGATSEA